MSQTQSAPLKLVSRGLLGRSRLPYRVESGSKSLVAFMGLPKELIPAPLPISLKNPSPSAAVPPGRGKQTRLSEEPLGRAAMDKHSRGHLPFSPALGPTPSESKT